MKKNVIFFISFYLFIINEICLNAFSLQDVNKDIKNIKIEKKQKPKIIGIIGDFLPNENNEHNYTNSPIYAIKSQYIDNFVKVCKNKNVSFVLLTDTPEHVDKIINSVDAIVLTGGGDDTPPFRRDEFEEKILIKAIEQKKQVLGICRGMQMINFFLGGDVPLIKDVNPNAINHSLGYACKNCKYLHDVVLKENSLIKKIIKKDKIQVSSRHSFTIDELGENVKISSVSPIDNIIESIELIDYPKFFLGVQWHPENLYTIDDEKLIEAFCESVEKDL